MTARLLYFFNIAAIIYYKLRKKFDNTQVMGVIAVHNKRSLARVQKLSWNSCVEEIFESHKTELLAAESGEVELKDCVSYFEFFYALDYVSGFHEFKMQAITDNKPLNSNYTEDIEIYITFPSGGYLNSANDEYSGLFNNLIFFVKLNDLYRHFKIENVYFENIDSGIRVGYVPYPITSKEVVKEEGNTLTALPNEKLDAFDEKFIENCQCAVTEYSCDIVFGPEIHGSRDIDRKLREYCCEAGCKVMICPSYVEETEFGEKYNRASVYVWKDPHRETIKIAKYFAARFHTDKREGIDTPETRKFLILHFEHFGRVGFFICKEYLTDGIRKLIDYLNLSFSIVQCYTDSITDFKARMKENISQKHWIAMGNSCHALKSSSTTIPFLYTAYNYEHTKTEENNELIPLTCSEKNCLENDCAKIFELNFEENKLKISWIKE